MLCIANECFPWTHGQPLSTELNSYAELFWEEALSGGRLSEGLFKALDPGRLEADCPRLSVPGRQQLEEECKLAHWKRGTAAVQ